MNCIIVDEMHASIEPMLMEAGFKADYRPHIKREQILEVIHHYEGIIIRSKTAVDREMLDKATCLKFIGRAGAGLDQLDVDEIEKRNIAIINAPEGNQDALAEHAVGMILCLFNKINTGNQQVKNYIWDREGNRGIELKGKTVGLIGYGYMGQAFAQRLTSFGCNILAYDKYKKNFSSAMVREVQMEDLFRECDVLSLHIPLTSETKGLVNRNFIDKFKKNIFLINTSRGPIVKLSDLNKSLEVGKILGAALDVIENEKLNTFTEKQKKDFDKLISFSNVLLTPHVGGWSVESYYKINQVLVQKLKAFKINFLNS